MGKKKKLAVRGTNMTIPGMLVENVKKQGSAVALREKDFGIWQEVSYEQYLEHVRNCALGFIKLGLKKDDRVCILGDNCREWLYCDLGIQSVGAVSAGIYPTNPVPQVKYILEHSEAKFVVVYDQEQLDKVLECKKDLPNLRKAIVIDMKGLRHYKDPLIMGYQELEDMGRELAEKEPSLFEEVLSRIQPDDVALMVYTSGTTGQPKAAMITHRNIISMVDQWLQVTPVYDRDNYVSYLPLCHVAERCVTVVMSLRAGVQVNFSESIDTIQQALRDIAPDVYLAVPRIWEKMYSNHIIRLQESTYFKKLLYKMCIPVGEKVVNLKSAGRKPWGWLLLRALADLMVFRPIRDQLGLRKAHLYICGAAPTAPEIKKFFHIIGIRVREMYGSTEGSGLVTIHQGDDIKFNTVGKIVPGMEIKIAEDGEILLKGPSVFKGYFKNEEATAKTLVGGWLYTGDVGVIDEDGHLKITDRKKDIIITAGGKNISPQEIENRLKVSPYIKDAIVVGDKRKYVTSLIEIEYENVGHWAETKGIPYTNFKDLAKNKDVYDLIMEEVKEANKDFAQVETIKKITLLDKQLDQDDEELTATQKLRRSAVEKKYADVIQLMYK